MDKMIDALFVGVFYSEIIDDEGKDGAVRLVSEETGSVCLMVAMQ